MSPADIVARSRDASLLRAELGEAEFATARAEGRACTRSDAEALVAAVVEARLSPELAPAPPVVAGNTLTRRERDVLRLLVTGRTDHQIAVALSISQRTVSWHVRAILGKMGVSTRRDAIVLAHDQGFV
jgi:DNA-binding NarL/FixJ family response regulator